MDKDYMKSRIREICTYGSVRGDRLPLTEIEKEECRVRLLDWEFILRRFVGRRVVKFPKYRMVYVFLLVIGGFMILINGLVELYLQVGNQKIGEEIILKEILGFDLDKSELGWEWFYRDVYGLELVLAKEVWDNGSNLNELLETEELGLPTVYIYNTFQTYKYKNSYYNSYNVAPVVSQASYILQEYLRDYKINSIVEKKSVVKVLKDNGISYTNSYKGSRILMEEAKNNNASLEYYIDIQLADRVYSETTTVIDGVSYAKVLFVVGTDNEGSDANKNLMIDLNSLLERENKELSRGVSLRGGVGYQGIYNQDFSGKVMLIQVGGKENTIDEVNRTLEILAEVLSEYMGVV